LRPRAAAQLQLPLLPLHQHRAPHEPAANVRREERESERSRALAWVEVCKVIEDPEIILAELRSRQGANAALDEEIYRVRTTIKTLDAQKQRAMRLFTIGEADDADVKRELSRINKLYLQAQSRLAELECRRAGSLQFEPMAE